MSSSRPEKRPANDLRDLLPADTSAGRAATITSPPDIEVAPTRGPPLPDPNPITPKRPRIGVAIACDRCRTKKIRCDGQKPTCSACSRKGISKCHYEDPSARKSNLGHLVEAVRLLKSLTPSRAYAALRRVSGLDQDADVVAALRELASLSERRQSEALDSSSTFEAYLEAKHPTAYPAFEPIDPREPSDHLKRLVKPRHKEAQEHENMPTEPDDAQVEDTQAMADAKLLAPAPAQQAPNPLLRDLDMTKWTSVPVSDAFAARAISLYFTTDHPLLFPFDQNLFTASLLSGVAGHYCSAALVNALMYWCCQTCASVDPDAMDKAELFRIETARLMQVEQQPYTVLNMVAEMFLGLGHLMQGSDEATLSHLSKASNTGIQLGLFGVPETAGEATLSTMTKEQREAAAYPAWGVFNWTVLMSLFYRQQGIIYPEYPPSIPIPTTSSLSECKVNDPKGKNDDDEDNRDEDGDEQLSDASSLREEQDDDLPRHQEVFASLCRFWKIMREVTAAYYDNETASIKDSISLEFAEFKFRELLAWADTLPAVLERSDHNSDVVVVLHLWLHSAILDVFRPFLKNEHHLRTFPATNATPLAAYTASVSQLKHLIITYRSKYTSSNYTIVWQTALLYTANAMLRSTDDDRLEYFLICLYSFQGLRQCFRVTEAIAKALLSMAMQKGDIGGGLASTILADLRASAPERQEIAADAGAAFAAATGNLKLEDERADGKEEKQQQHSIRAPFMANLELAMSDPEAATVEQLANQFDESFWITRYTNLFDPEV